MVSIIVPVYNVERYLPHCANSLLGQTHRELEILLVDDGSTDGSGALCDSIAASDRRVRVIHKKNGGLSSARNAGLENASGRWILFVDGDDYLAPHAVEKLVAVAQSTDADLVQFLYHETPDTSWQSDSNQQPNTTVVSDLRQMFERLYAMGGVAASSCTKLFRSSLFDELRFQEGVLHEDEELITRLLPLCRSVAYTELELYGYVMRSGSIIRSDFKRRHMDVFAVMERRISALQALEYEELVRETRSRLFRTAAWQYCLARKGGYKEESEILKEYILKLSKHKDLPLTGQYRVLYKLAGITHVAVDVFYFIRRMCGKS